MPLQYAILVRAMFSAVQRKVWQAVAAANQESVCVWHAQPAAAAGAKKTEQGGDEGDQLVMHHRISLLVAGRLKFNSIYADAGACGAALLLLAPLVDLPSAAQRDKRLRLAAS